MRPLWYDILFQSCPPGMSGIIQKLGILTPCSRSHMPGPEAGSGELAAVSRAPHPVAFAQGYKVAREIADLWEWFLFSFFWLFSTYFFVHGWTREAQRHTIIEMWFERDIGRDLMWSFALSMDFCLMDLALCTRMIFIVCSIHDCHSLLAVFHFCFNFLLLFVLL